MKLLAVHQPIYKSNVISKKMFLLALTMYLTFYILYLIIIYYIDIEIYDSKFEDSIQYNNLISPVFKVDSID